MLTKKKSVNAWTKLPVLRSLKPQRTSEIPIMASAQAYQYLVLDHKVGTLGADNRLKIAVYPKAVRNSMRENDTKM